MAKFRKIPVVVEAFQLTKITRWNNHDWPEWMNRAWNLGDKEVGSLSPFYKPPDQRANDCDPLAIITLEGRHRADIGDWIICGVKGELYPCKPDIFPMIYEAVQ